MELTIDFTAGFLIFITALSLCLTWLISSLGNPAPVAIEPRAYAYSIHLTIYRDGEQLVIDCVEGLVVESIVVCFEGDGSYVIVKGRTPLSLGLYDFIVVFAGSCVKAYGSPPPNLRGYVTPHGVYSKPVETPYAYVENKRVIAIVPVEVGRFVLGFKRLVIVNGTVMIGGR
ncbi:MAG: hypothetical protein DRN15_11350 [Thermoprotei archaeon]|nr:MAG: hypothetical protein DRN15_11350 [Thermoprotei archaeon]